MLAQPPRERQRPREAPGDCAVPPLGVVAMLLVVGEIIAAFMRPDRDVPFDRTATFVGPLPMGRQPSSPVLQPGSVLRPRCAALWETTGLVG